MTFHVQFHNCNRCGKPKRSRRAKSHRLCFRCMIEESKRRDAEWALTTGQRR